jgi:hypothetical protein
MENDQVRPNLTSQNARQLTVAVQGVLVDLYVPRKCAATSTAKSIYGIQADN